MNHNNLLIMDEQLTNDIEVMTSFLSILAYIIKELLTKSDMATNDIDKDMSRQEQMERSWYIPPIGRGRNLVVDLTGREEVWGLLLLPV